MDNQRIRLLISRLDREIDTRHRALAEDLNLPVAAVDVLEMLYIRNGRSASDLARSIGRAPTSFTPTLDSLERAGYIERRPDPKDRRVIRIFLTDQGKRAEKSVRDSLRLIDTELRDLLEHRAGSMVDSGYFDRLFAPLSE